MMSINSPDSHKISLKIIEAIKLHPVLYISEVKGNAIKLQEFKQKVWKRISDELGLDPVWVKLKWKNLRDTYCRILKYKKKSPKGLRRKKWIFEDHLNFLKFPYESNYESQHIELTEEYINDINKEVINSQDFLEQLENNIEDDDYSEYLEILEENTNLEENHVQESLENDDNVILEGNDDKNLQRLAIDAYAKQIQSKYRKIRPKKIKIQENTNIKSLTPIFINTQPIIPLRKPMVSENIQNIKKITKATTEKNNYDHKSSIDHFFNKMAQVVKKLPPKAQADIKMDICKIVSEAEIHHSRQNPSETIQKYTSMPGMIPKLVLVPCQMLDN
ncbi:PREDICTED: uncharacterized protein LOC105364483 [Ceratosolen solmsi marchali]|uniref:Uncharacterized protein LOC105364483 n=1 Tax=Ceratosolen solmsi marchali TaxID=326594 RepID=A0AAJ6YMC6_9HYME|nr:PREDICTED: uncharacterized protein LOC105364483 [Ceratosolen solmsi marchali]